MMLLALDPDGILAFTAREDQCSPADAILHSKAREKIYVLLLTP